MNIEHTVVEGSSTASSPAAPARVELSLAEALGLVLAGGREPRVPSPLAVDGLQPVEADAELRTSLVRARWIEGEPAPIATPIGRAILDRLARPEHRTDILIGTGTWWFRWVGLGSGASDTPLVAWSTDLDDRRGAVSFPHPPTQPVDLLGAHLRVGRIDDPIALDVEFSRQAYMCWIGILDDYLDVQLRAMLDRLPVVRDHFDVDDIGDALAEGRTSAHLAWQTPVTAALWPELLLSSDDDDLRAGLDELAALRLIEPLAEGGYQPHGTAKELLDRLVPVARWASVTVARRADHPERGVEELGIARLGIRRGLGAMVVERLLDDGRVSMRSIGDTDLELLLLDVAAS